MKFDQIRRVRKAAHVTQEELAKRIGVNRALISKYETGIIEPSVSQLQKNCFSSWCANDGTAGFGGRGGTNQTG